MEKKIDLKLIEKIKKQRIIKPEQPESSLCGLELIKQNNKISKNYIELDFQKLFSEVLAKHQGIGYMSVSYSFSSKTKTKRICRSNPHTIIKDSKFGIFRIEDMGENYLIPIQKFNDSIIRALIEHFTENGVICKQVNENYLSISKIKRDFSID